MRYINYFNIGLKLRNRNRTLQLQRLGQSNFLAISLLLPSIVFLLVAFSVVSFSQTYLLSERGSVSNCSETLYDITGSSSFFCTTEDYILTTKYHAEWRVVKLDIVYLAMGVADKLKIYEKPGAGGTIKPKVILGFTSGGINSIGTFLTLKSVLSFEHLDFLVS
jgi:hypothetical protein